MTWAQTITIVVPTLIAIIAGIFYSNKQTDLVARIVGDLRTDTNARFAAVDARFGAIDARFGGIDGRLNGLDARLDRLEEKFDVRFDRFHERFDARFEKVDARFDRLESKFDRELGELRLLLLDVLKPKTL